MVFNSFFPATTCTKKDFHISSYLGYINPEMCVLKLYSFVIHSRNHTCYLLSTIEEERHGPGRECVNGDR